MVALVFALINGEELDTPLEEHAAEMLLPHIKRSQLRWIGHFL